MIGSSDNSGGVVVNSLQKPVGHNNLTCMGFLSCTCFHASQQVLTRNHQILFFPCHCYVIAIVFIVLISNHNTDIHNMTTKW